MALFFYKTKGLLEDPHVEIRPIDEDEYVVAVSFHEEDGTDDDDVVTELTFTKEEAAAIYDAAHNR